MKRLEAQVSPAEVVPFSEADFAAHPALAKGYVGPGVLGSTSSTGIRYLVDPRVADGTAWVTGADSAGHHVIGLVAGRDFSADGTIQAAEVRDGDACPVCGAPLESARGIEMGHIFQLGRKYADALGLQVLDEHGALVTVTMGSYGIGVSRAVAALAEQHADDKGLIWSKEVAPADVHVVAAGKALQTELALDVSAKLAAAGVRVLVDDRAGVSPGVKFTDSELIGVPQILVAGRRAAEGVVELKDRRTGEREELTVEEAVARLTAL